jgi:hypothetical protein
MRTSRIQSVLGFLGLFVFLGPLILAGPATPAHADEPWNYSTVTGSISMNGVLLSPGPSGGNTLVVTVRNSYNNPVQNAVVQVVFNPAIRTCADALHGGYTDAAGQCRITLRGGGCLSNTVGACVVVANGIEIRNFFNVRSPDNASHAGSLPDGLVAMADLPFFADEFTGRVPAACHDYDCDTNCNTVDLPYFGDTFRAAAQCTLLR